MTSRKLGEKRIRFFGGTLRHYTFTIISKNHEYFSKPSTTANEKAAAAENAALFTKKMPFYSTEVPITRKMHVMGFHR